jgi:tRNA pseudouridine13 synthase
MIPPPEAERGAGIEVYVTDTPPCYAKMRSFDEDFRVEEVLKADKVAPGPFPGSFPLYRVEKRSIDTFHLERTLSSILRSRVSHAGIKDKRARAIQFFSPTSTRSARPQVVETPEFRCELVGYLRRPLSGSMIAGNRFRIVLRGCCPTIGSCVSESMKACREKRMPNFYGLQRFGVREARTHRVGRAIVQGDFKKAVEVLLWEPRDSDDDTTGRAREMIAEGRYEEGRGLLPTQQDIERVVSGRLAKSPGDHVNAIRAVPIALRRMYVQAYQSYIFNRAMSLALRNGLDIARTEEGDNWGEVSTDGLRLKKVHGVKETHEDGAVPLVQLVGYAYRDYGSRFDRCTEEVLTAEGVGARNFYVKEMQEVSVEGGFRRAYMTVNEESYEASADMATLGFTLARGEYATVLLREVIKPGDPATSGFG